MHRRGLAAFVGLYTTAGLGLAAAYWNYEFIFYGVVLLLIIAGVVWLDRRVKLPAPVLYGLAFWGLVHLLGGTIPIGARWAEPGSSGTLYNLRVAWWLPKYDQVVHAFGFGVASLAGWRALVAASEGRLRPGVGSMIAMVLIGMGLGAMNEVIEFTATRIMPETNVGGYDNTGWDLVSNLAGCVLAAGWVLVRPAFGREPAAAGPGPAVRPAAT